MSFKPPTFSAAAADHGLVPYETVAEVRLITCEPPNMIHVEELGTIFRWMDTSTATDNGVSILKVTAITKGRYVSKY